MRKVAAHNKGLFTATFAILAAVIITAVIFGVISTATAANATEMTGGVVDNNQPHLEPGVVDNTMSCGIEDANQPNVVTSSTSDDCTVGGSTASTK